MPLIYQCDDCDDKLDDPTSLIEHELSAHDRVVSLSELARPTFITQLQARGVDHPRDIACRRCARETRCVSGIWRHVDDDTLACVDPTTMQPQGDKTDMSTTDSKIKAPTVKRPSKQTHRQWFATLSADEKLAARQRVQHSIDVDKLSEADAWQHVVDVAALSLRSEKATGRDDALASSKQDKTSKAIVDALNGNSAELEKLAADARERKTAKSDTKRAAKPSVPVEVSLVLYESTPATARKAAGVHFWLNDKPKRGLSSIAYDGTRGMLDAESPRMSSAQFKAWLVEQGVESPAASSYSIILPNGNVVRVEHVAVAVAA